MLTPRNHRELGSKRQAILHVAVLASALFADRDIGRIDRTAVSTVQSLFLLKILLMAWAAVLRRWEDRALLKWFAGTIPHRPATRALYAAGSLGSLLALSRVPGAGEPARG